MLCNHCGGESRVAETRLNKRLFANFRQRECLNCGHKFKTVETYQSSYFSDNRILKSFAAAANKRINLRLRDLHIASSLHLGWKLLSEKYSLTKSAVYYAAKSGRNHLRKLK